jgi:hypothetical protein
MEGFQGNAPAPAPSSSSKLTDNYFKCSESPILLTPSQVAEVKRLYSAADSYRVSALISGTGTVSVVPDGLSIAGSTSNVLVANTVNCNWNESRLVVPGAHAVISNGGTDLVKGDAEFQVYFKSDKRATDIYCICIPVFIGSGRGRDYFASLGLLTRSSPLFTSLWSESTGFLQYTGKDLRNRTPTTCGTDANKVRYLVATEPAYINVNDLSRLKTSLTTANGYKAGPTPQSVSNKLSLISYIPSIAVSSASTSETRKVANGYVEQAQVKCRPLDQKRDISGNMIYVGGNELRGDTTLDKELQDAAKFQEGEIPTPSGAIQSSDIETILGIVLGVVVGIVVIAFLVVWLLRKTETRYLKTLKNYSTAGFESTSQLAKAVWDRIKPEPCKKVVEKAVLKAVDAAKLAQGT